MVPSYSSYSRKQLMLGSLVIEYEDRSIYRGYFFSVNDPNLFHREDTIGNIFTSGAATRENITEGVQEME